MRKWILVATAAAWSLGIVAQANAGADSDALRQFGLFGKWGNCRAGQSFIVFEETSRGPEQYSINKGNAQRKELIRNARLASDHSLTYDLDRQTLTLIKTGSGFRIMQMKDLQTGNVFVKDGRWQNGTETGAHDKCS